jgi:hypothetical protein
MSVDTDIFHELPVRDRMMPGCIPPRAGLHDRSGVGGLLRAQQGVIVTKADQIQPA